MTNATACVRAPSTGDPCPRCDLLLGLEGVVHVEGVERTDGHMRVEVSTPSQLMGCPDCGVVAPSRGRRVRRLPDVPHGSTRVVLLWRQRVWRCPDPACARGTFTEQVPDLVRARGSVTARAVAWAMEQLRREHATISGLARQLGIAWKTMWRAIKPVLEHLDSQEQRFAGVKSLGVDEHIWHHGDPRRKGPKELTGMVDLTRDEQGRVHSGCWTWSRAGPRRPTPTGSPPAETPSARTSPWRRWTRSEATRPRSTRSSPTPSRSWTPSTSSSSAPRSWTRSAAASSRPPWATAAARVTPSTASRRSCGPGAENLTDKQLDRLATAIQADPAHEEVYIAWRCAQDLRATYRDRDTAAGKKRAEKILDSFHTCPIPEVARLGRTLRRWREAFLAYFTTGRANNGPTEAVNGIIELHRRLARGYRNRTNYRLRMLLAAGGLTP